MQFRVFQFKLHKPFREPIIYMAKKLVHHTAPNPMLEIHIGDMISC